MLQAKKLAMKNPLFSYMTTLQLLHVHMCGQLDLLVCCSNLPCTDTTSAILCTVPAILGLWVATCLLDSTTPYNGSTSFLWNKRRHYDLAMIQTLIIWTLVRCSYQLSHWDSGIEADGIDCNIQHSLNEVHSYWSTFCCSPGELGITSHLACAYITSYLIITSFYWLYRTLKWLYLVLPHST